VSAANARTMKTYLFTYTLALLISMALTPMVIAWAKGHNLVDLPDPRKVHKRPVARVGGLAIFAAALLAILPVPLIRNSIGLEFRAVWVETVALIIGASAVFCVGLYDDLRGARVRTKLGVELVAAAAMCMAGIRVSHVTLQGLGQIDLGWWGYLIAGVWIVGITNAMNLIDGLDGLAAGIAAMACGVIAALSVLEGNVILAILMLALLGSLTGFLFFNFHPAKVFMGDCGSLFLGFTIATASVLSAGKSETLVGLGLPVLVLGIPIFDTLFSILRRFLERRGIMSPDRGHFHHRLLDLGLGHREVALLAYLVTAGITGLGLFMLIAHSTASVTIFLCCLVLLLTVFRSVGAVRLKETLDGIRHRTALNTKQRIERKAFEEAQLRFRNARTFDQWWECMCKAGEALDCSRICLEMATRDNGRRSFVWQKDQNGQSDPLAAAEVLRLRVPIKDRRAGQTQQIEIDVMAADSMESAGHRATLFARLTEENGLDSLPEQ